MIQFDYFFSPVIELAKSMIRVSIILSQSISGLCTYQRLSC